MNFPDRLLNGSTKVKRLLTHSALAAFMATGCSLPQYATETSCATKTVIKGKTPELTLKQKGRFTARAYDVDSAGRNARILIALEPGALVSKQGSQDLGKSQSTEDIDLTLLIDASTIPPAIGVRYSFPGDNGDRMFATLATEAVGYRYNECNFLDMSIQRNAPQLTVNNGKVVTPALPM